MATEWGIRQFIDLGAGFPTQRNTHEVVGEARDDGRVVYVDNDPRVIARGREILAGLPGTAVVEADIRDVDTVLDHAETRRLIDFDEPVGLLLVAVTHYMTDADDPWDLVARYVRPLSPGSYLALSSITRDRQERTMDKMINLSAAGGVSGQARSLSEIERFFAGLEIVPPYEGADPAVTYVGLWGAENPEAADDDGSRLAYAAVARKP
jgi:SAM-dependent methyltransferase